MELSRGKFKGKLISKWGDVARPPRSPELIVPYYYPFGYLKDTVDRNIPQNIDALKTNIRNEVMSIPTENLKDVMSSVPARMDDCMKSQGKHLKNVNML